MEETFPLPTGVPIPADLRQRVSRFAGAYIENIGQGGVVSNVDECFTPKSLISAKIRIVAKDERSLSRAKRFASRAATEVSTQWFIPRRRVSISFPGRSDGSFSLIFVCT